MAKASFVLLDGVVAASHTPETSVSRPGLTKVSTLTNSGEVMSKGFILVRARSHAKQHKDRCCNGP